MTPPRDTVAGEQWFMWLISSSKRMLEVSGMRSLEASVSILLSSCARGGVQMGGQATMGSQRLARVCCSGRREAG